MDPATISMLASLGIQGGTALWNLFKKKPKNPADQAMPYFDKIPDTLKGYLNPYIQQGQGAYGQLNPLYSNMAQNPAGYLESLMKSYQPSTGFKMKQNDALQAAANTSAAGGMRGSYKDAQSQALLSDLLQDQDMQQWLSNVTGVQGSGMQGLQGFYDTGARAGSELGSDLANVLASQGSLKFQGQQQRNQGSQDIASEIMKSLSGIGGTLGGFDWSKLGNKGATGGLGNQFLSAPRSGVNLGVNYGGMR